MPIEYQNNFVKVLRKIQCFFSVFQENAKKTKCWKDLIKVLERYDLPLLKAKYFKMPQKCFFFRLLTSVYFIDKMQIFFSFSKQDANVFFCLDAEDFSIFPYLMQKLLTIKVNSCKISVFL